MKTQQQIINELEKEQAEDCKRIYTRFQPFLPPKRRSFWQWIISFLPLFLLISVSLAATYTVDQYGNVRLRSNSPEGYNVFIFWPNWNNVVPVPLPRRATPVPSPTPSPTPCPADERRN